MAEGGRKLDSGPGIKVVIKTPDGYGAVSRGFYQVEEDSLYVPLHPAGKFFSYLDSPQATFDIDNAGRLLFLHIHTPREAWDIFDQTKPPVISNPADIRFMDFRNTLPAFRPETAADKSWLRLRFEDSRQTVSYQAAENLIFEITTEATLASIWIMAIDDDRAAQGMARWRKMVAKEAGGSDNVRSCCRIEIKYR